MTNTNHRIRLHFSGVVQGVGFRPTIFRMAQEHGLTGWIQNTGNGVSSELEGPRIVLQVLLEAILKDIPPPVRIDSHTADWLPATGLLELEIRQSISEGPRSALIPADIAICASCLNDMAANESLETTPSTPKNRRIGYPFTTCTQCGPRYSLIENIPFDRAVTTMRDFIMCQDCRTEYSNPLDRRFHSQTNCCPKCGPQYTLCDRNGLPLASGVDIWALVQSALLDGKILALKGLGGYQLVALASNAAAVTTLRHRKRRPSKAFAMMIRSLDAVRQICVLTPPEEAVLTSQAAPIVLLDKLFQQNPSTTNDTVTPRVAPGVAPDTQRLGIMLPTTGAHAILTALVEDPLIVTSGNLSGEPICIDEETAFSKLSPIADLFLIHNRRISRAVDDSVVQLILDIPQVLRCARGYAPLPLMTAWKLPLTLGLGAQFKNTIALSLQSKIYMSQHLGDLQNAESYSSFIQTCQDFQNIYEVKSPQLVCDLHPDYQSTHFANQLATPSTSLLKVQHHWAHALACAAEHKVEFPFHAVVWDGTGYGDDGTSWGGEFLLGKSSGYTRVGHLRTFRLPGGDLASRQPKRSLAGILYELFDDGAKIDPLFKTIMEKSVNSPKTSSAGRLFDGVAALIGLNADMSYEGEAAIKLQTLAENAIGSSTYSIGRSYQDQKPPYQLDWGPMIEGIIADLLDSVPREIIARKFHFTLAKGLVQIASRVCEKRIILTGGCFQNKLLLELTIQQLQEKNFVVYWPQKIPPNDGGIALGQIMAAHLEKP